MMDPGTLGFAMATMIDGFSESEGLITPTDASINFGLGATSVVFRTAALPASPYFIVTTFYKHFYPGGIEKLPSSYYPIFVARDAIQEGFGVS
jgi:hypothetical protein